MLEHDHGTKHDTTERVNSSRVRWVFGGFAAIAVVLLALEHRAHLLGWLPWMFLLACPLMHLFMHGGHGGHDGHRQSEDGRKGDES
ncbi:DUF2933 domain-containing protein [Aromatoleum petrolei]|uniref:DUF2933 domain-containing protein n=1 Tax=Aromatoleum petrolei TaxID=76116 RepID=A0ABX1MU67_9RHOO|nr:DUF2933 domain-containing protein [Aromatoleum petrolei]NMF89880.1 DUF2933 domain-containing protein [Aromatoleum petrolei]QTQ34485.1 putative protein DUF2933 [Aromatoleum petrolei]